MQKPSNIIKNELIGLEIKISKSTNKANIGIEGTVIDESRNMFIINTSKGQKKIIKKDNMFEIKLPDGNVVEIDGNILIGKPESRLKTALQKKRI